MSVIELSLAKSPKKSTQFGMIRKRIRATDSSTRAKGRGISSSRNQIRMNHTQSYGDESPHKKCRKMESILLSEVPFALLPNKEKQRLIESKNKEEKDEEEAIHEENVDNSYEDNEFANLFKNAKNSGKPMSFNQEVLHCFYTNKDQSEFDEESFQSSLRRLIIKQRSKVDSSIILPNLSKKPVLNTDIYNPYESLKFGKAERSSSLDAASKTPLVKNEKHRFSSKYVPKLKPITKPKSPDSITISRNKFKIGSRRESNKSFKIDLKSIENLERKISNNETEATVKRSSKHSQEKISSHKSTSPKKKKTSEEIVRQAEEAYLRMNKVLIQCNEISNKEKYFKSNPFEFAKKLRHERLRRKLITMKD